MNIELCQECHEREAVCCSNYDPKTAEFDDSKFLCDICNRIHLIANGWVEQENGSWYNAALKGKF